MANNGTRRPRSVADATITVSEYDLALSKFKDGKSWATVLGTDLAKEPGHVKPAQFCKLFPLLDNFIGLGLRNCTSLPCRLEQAVTNTHTNNSDLMPEVVACKSNSLLTLPITKRIIACMATANVEQF